MKTKLNDQIYWWKSRSREFCFVNNFRNNCEESRNANKTTSSFLQQNFYLKIVRELRAFRFEIQCKALQCSQTRFINSKLSFKSIEFHLLIYATRYANSLERRALRQFSLTNSKSHCERWSFCSCESKFHFSSRISSFWESFEKSSFCINYWRTRISFCSICFCEFIISFCETSCEIMNCFCEYCCEARNFLSENFTLIAKIRSTFCNRCNFFFNRRNFVCNRVNSICDCEDRNVNRERFTNDRKINRIRFQTKREAFSSISSENSRRFKFCRLINKDFLRNSKTNSATITCEIRRIHSNWSQTSSTNRCEHFRSRWLNVRRYAKHLRKIANVYASRLMFELTRIMWWSRYCKIARKFDVQRRQQRANVNDRIAMQSSSYELSWTIFTDISSFISSNELRVTMSEMSLRDIRFWFSI